MHQIGTTPAACEGLPEAIGTLIVSVGRAAHLRINGAAITEIDSSIVILFDELAAALAARGDGLELVRLRWWIDFSSGARIRKAGAAWVGSSAS